jgi:hypothetical protein
VSPARSRTPLADRVAAAYSTTAAMRITRVGSSPDATSPTPAPNSWKIALPACEIEFPCSRSRSPRMAGSDAPLMASRRRVPASTSRRETYRAASPIVEMPRITTAASTNVRRPLAQVRRVRRFPRSMATPRNGLNSV